MRIFIVLLYLTQIKVLRLKVNNKEDLLITGAKKPEHRGVCLHLLKKVDAKSIAHALGLMRDAESKTRFLGSVIRFYPDLPNVLLYLESLSASVPRDEAARGDAEHRQVCHGQWECSADQNVLSTSTAGVLA
mgnify:CR=1 FL=1